MVVEKNSKPAISVKISKVEKNCSKTKNAYFLETFW